MLVAEAVVVVVTAFSVRDVRLKIETIKVEAIQRFENNPRIHSESQIDQIAASIQQFGFTNPLLINGSGGLIAGHGRLEAAIKLGMQKVPAIRLAHLTEDQQRALVIADNKIAENSTWDDELLRAELAALQSIEFDFQSIGYGDEDLAAILEGLAGEDPGKELLGDPDHIPDPVVDPVSRAGDLWLLGDHRVICGSATNAADVIKVSGGESTIDCVWTDPPYNVNYEGAAGKIQNDNMAAADFRGFLLAAYRSAIAVMRSGAPIYVAHADTEGRAFRGAFADAGLKLSGCLVWVKPSLVLGRSDYQWRHEPILYGWKPGAAHTWFGGRSNTTVLEVEGSPLRILDDETIQIDVGDRIVEIKGKGLSLEVVEGSVIRADKPRRNDVHPTMKPVDLIVGMLRRSSKKGACVLDMFGGSGSTLMACEVLGRKARMVELDPRFVDVIVKRWEVATGNQATLMATGQAFSEVAADRKLCLEEA
ncbi:site-specific DNA-methyltransferase [Oceaniovalibus sp. ACAM 378]|uniref:site-specific DNA-methyltransferase n=1 Tax=Oceaniovalibus sp. ACAM 378 TaxID=2599923 RepID=UPI001652191D|nr:site-specific DNA-methyltransferase [Oceaniovalibus sp. ACAM 378]